MRRVVLAILMVAALAMSGGCIGVSATEHKEIASGGDCDVVAVGDHVYVVNKATGRVREVDLSAAELISAGQDERE